MGEIDTSFILLSVPESNTPKKKKKLVIIIVISTFSGILALGLVVWFISQKKRIMATGKHTNSA